MVTHSDMRAVLREAFRRVIGRDGTTSELQCVQAVASIESGYAQWWKPPGNGSWNFGAIQKGSSWTGPTFQYQDSKPQPDGSSKLYVTKFRKYLTMVAGAEDLIKVVYRQSHRDQKVLPQATAGSTLGFSTGLYDTVYYEGFGKDGPDPGTSPREERIANHHRGIVASIRAQALELNEELPKDIASLPPKRPLLRLGSKGPDVKILQELLNKHRGTGAGSTPALVVDEDFGKKTGDAVYVFQVREGLTADRIVGERTFEALLANESDTDPSELAPPSS